MQVHDARWFFGVSALVVAYLVYIIVRKRKGERRNERARAGTLNPTGAAV